MFSAKCVTNNHFIFGSQGNFAQALLEGARGVKRAYAFWNLAGELVLKKNKYIYLSEQTG